MGHFGRTAARWCGGGEHTNCCARVRRVRTAEDAQRHALFTIGAQFLTRVAARQLMARLLGHHGGALLMAPSSRFSGCGFAA